MAVAPHTETTEELRTQIASEREQLAAAVEEMRDAADPAKLLGPKLPLLAVGAFAAGFVLAGGVGATMRLVFRRGREGREEARVGRFSLIKRR